MKIRSSKAMKPLVEKKTILKFGFCFTGKTMQPVVSETRPQN